MSEVRPAFYALARGGWRDYVTLLHVPYTLWHLSYVAIGAALAPHFDGALLGWTLLAFFLALGIAAHALDELHGRPLRTEIPSSTLIALAIASTGGAAAIGVGVAVRHDLWLLLFVVVGAGLVFAYNLELVGGALHNDVTFALAWGSFPVLVAYFASAHTLRLEALGAAAFAALLSHAQRTLSTVVRGARRGGTATEAEIAQLTRAPERALRLLTAAVVVLALALVAMRVT
jgi:hypothetical protein